MKWTERWIARAQRQADLRAQRYVRHAEGVRTGTEPPGLIDRMESWTTLSTKRAQASHALQRAYANERRITGSRLYHPTPGLADAWRTWVMDGPVRGPDRIRIAISVRSDDQDLPFGDPSGAQAQVTETQKVYTVFVRRLPAGPVQTFCSFTTETSARWYAVELAPVWRTRRRCCSARSSRRSARW